jgi:rSAM/selenodomain-associated transferase 2
VEGALISVVIPTLDEATHIERTLDSARDPRVVERIVVDGGSSDDTSRRAAAAGGMVVESPPGRAHQLNRGAELATGEILLFVHGDTLLPSGFGAEVMRVLDGASIAAGAFPVRLDEPGLTCRLIERGVNWRSKALQLPYGDQALFMARDTFRDLGGYPNQPLMEDYVLVRAVRRLGRIGLARKPVITSARRWRSLGPVRTTLINQMVIVGYHLGVSPARLARLYGVRGRRSG